MVEVVPIAKVEGVVKRNVVGVVLGIPSVWWAVEKGFDLSADRADMSFAGIALEQKYTGAWSIEAFLVPVVMLVALTFVTSLLPAMRAARLDPAEALRRR